MPRKKQKAAISLEDYLHILTSAALEYEENGGVVEFSAQPEGVTIFLPLVGYDADRGELVVPAAAAAGTGTGTHAGRAGEAVEKGGGV